MPLALPPLLLRTREMAQAPSSPLSLGRQGSAPHPLPAPPSLCRFTWGNQSRKVGVRMPSTSPLSPPHLARCRGPGCPAGETHRAARGWPWSRHAGRRTARARTGLFRGGANSIAAQPALAVPAPCLLPPPPPPPSSRATGPRCQEADPRVSRRSPGALPRRSRVGAPGSSLGVATEPRAAHSPPRGEGPPHLGRV